MDSTPTVEQLEERVKDILEQVKPYLQSEGCDCALDRIENNVVYVHIFGPSVGSASSIMTLKLGIERRILEELSEISSVEAV